MNINDFCKTLKNKYPNTKEVLEQIEEIRDTLYMKLEEYQSEGCKYEEASQKSIESLGNIDDLFEEITTDVKVIYDGRARVLANIISAIIVFSTMTAMSLLSQVLPLLHGLKPTIITGYISTVIGFSVVFLMLSEYILNINKVSIVKVNIKEKRKQIFVSLVIPIVCSILMIIINFYQFPSFEIIWFPWPIMGISNWPICLLIYFKLINSKKFDAKIVKN